MSEVVATHASGGELHSEINCLCVSAGQAEFIIHNGLAGAMFWTLDFDDFGNSACGQGNYPLISEVRRSLEAAQSVIATGCIFYPVSRSSSVHIFHLSLMRF